MFRVRDYSVFTPSPNAARSFRALRRMDFAVNGALGVLAMLCLWNIGRLVQLRLVSNQELSAVADIIDEPSTKLIWVLSTATLGMIVAREWVWGERSIGVIYPLAALLAILLVPAMMSEIQPALRDQTLRLVMNECPPKAIVDARLSNAARCDPHAIGEGDVLLATSNPVEGEFATIDPISGGQNTIAFTMSGRGTYTVYFMFRQEDMATCEKAMLFPHYAEAEAGQNSCVTAFDNVWLVMPHTTSANSPSGIHLVNVTVP